MPAPTPDAPRRRLPETLLSALLALALVVVLAVVVLERRGERAPQAPSAAPTPTTETPPPFPEPPVSTIDRATLTVPEETRIAEHTFWGRAGEAYLITLDVVSEKPADSEGWAMYLGVLISCAPEAGGPGDYVGGTQNLRTGERTAYRNQLVVSPSADGAITCDVKLSAPYDDVASAGTAFEVEANWRADPVDGSAAAAATDGLPRTLAPGAEDTVLTAAMDLTAADDRALRGLTTIHLTTCTTVNGSREEGRAWCREGALDEAGSTATLTARLELLHADGAVCEELAVESPEPDHIDLLRHHRMISADLESILPAEPCGTTARLRVDLRNDGPAPLVVHRANSSALLVGS